MKKTFKLHLEGKNSDRVLEAIKHQVNKYIKRERRKQLPSGVDYWDFNCRFGVVEAEAEVVHLAEIRKKMDEVARNGGDSFYVEILAAPGIRSRQSTGYTPGRFSEG
ncbi:MAG TPA: DUF6172 family protein, partial [Cellvibrio sp.]|nr:DUF6172 family protein [Cellvibrio sp.]